MPRDGSGVYSADWVNAAPNTTIESSKQNALVADLVADANAARPLTAGGTAATTAVAGADNLSTQGTAIASATTTDIGAANGRYVHITGTTTITGLGTKTAGVVRILTFDGILTLTYNATSLILPGLADITTAAGDTAIMVSEGSGNWRCADYQRAAAPPVRSQAWELIENAAPAAVASKAFSNLSAYRALRITGYLIPATDGVNLFLRTSTNNGSSFDSGASDYVFQQVEAAGATLTGAQTTSDAIQLNRTTIGNQTSEGIGFNLNIEQFNANVYGQINGLVNVFTGAGAFTPLTVYAARLSQTPRDSIQFRFASGNIAGGNITVEGLR